MKTLYEYECPILGHFWPIIEVIQTFYQNMAVLFFITTGCLVSCKILNDLVSGTVFVTDY